MTKKIMTDSVRRMLMGLAQEDYMKAVEKRKAEERELAEEVKRRKEHARGNRQTDKQYSGSSEESG